MEMLTLTHVQKHFGEKEVFLAIKRDPDRRQGKCQEQERGFTCFSCRSR